MRNPQHLPMQAGSSFKYCDVLMLFVFGLGLNLAAPDVSDGQEAPVAAIHVILVADLTDTQIGVQKDLDRWNSEIDHIKQNTDATVTVHQVTDRMAATIIDTCTNLTVNSDDAVIFFYGGHGFNKDAANDPDRPAGAEANSDPASKWPEMLVFEQVGQRKRRRGLPLWRIFNQLKEKNPRLLLVIGDCCNEFMEEEDAPLTYSRGLGIPRYYKALFLESKGHYLVSSARVREFAFSNTKTGGYFGVKFFEAIGKATSFDRVRDNAHKKLYSKRWKPSWDWIFSEVSKGVIFENKEKKKGPQHAQWELIALTPNGN